MNAKDILLEKLVKEPLKFTDQDFDSIVATNNGLTFNDLREALKRVYNMSESALVTESDATSGAMGIFNRFVSRRRQKVYFNKINDGFVGVKENKIIVAEGDSWFQFFGKDVINWLDDREKYAIYSISYAGGWLANVLFEEKYIEELSIHKPSAFLISGGGNDLVGGNRLAIFTCLKPDKDKPVKRESIQELNYLGCSNEQAHQIISAQLHILPEFYAFLLILKCQYYLLFRSLCKAGDLQTMAIITQGYDYAIPYPGIRFDWKTPLQPLINSLVGSGKWLSQPLLIRGIKDPLLQRSILIVMIFELNEMFISLTRRAEFPYLYHIDSRNNAVFQDWFDELHLKPSAFKRVSDAYELCFESHFNHLKSHEKKNKNLKNIFVTKDTEAL